jgi:cyclophilin family peptidyl-prolyl cis-trans isomerase
MGGAYTETLVEKKAHPSIRNEAQRCALKNVTGTIAMVRKPDAPDSATCQFFINVTDNPNLDYKGPNAEEYGYCPFGKVTSGMDVVRKIAAVEVTDKTVDVPGKTDKAEFERVPKQAVVIQSIRFVR